MRANDFEKATEAIGCELLRLVYHAKSGGQINAAYGQVRGALTYIMWDQNGRGYAFVQEEGSEDCVSEYNLRSLPYERDQKFDLTFE